MKKYDLVTSIVLLILGILLVIVPGNIVTAIIRIFGFIILAIGIISIVSCSKAKSQNVDMVYGILIVILGIVFISNPHVIASIIPFLLGLWIIVKSVIRLQLVLLLKRNNTNDYIKPLVVNIITLILGLILVFNPFKGVEAIIRIVGGFMIVYSLLDILDYWFTRPKKVKVIK